MTSTDQLIEAIVYASDNNLVWYDLFDSKVEALRIINIAIKENPDEGQIMCFLSTREAEENIFEFHTVESAYKNELRIMKKELNDYI